MAETTLQGTTQYTMPPVITPVDTSVGPWLDRVQAALPGLTVRSQKVLAGLSQRSQAPGQSLRMPLSWQKRTGNAEYCDCARRGSDRKCPVERSPLRMRKAQVAAELAPAAAMADETSSVASIVMMSGELDAGALGLHRLHGWSPQQDPAQSRVPWEEQDCFKCLAEKHPVLAQAAQARADGSDPPDLGSHVQHQAAAVPDAANASIVRAM